MLRAPWLVLRAGTEGREAMQFGVLGLVHHTHAAAAKPLQDAIVGNSLPDGWHRTRLWHAAYSDGGGKSTRCESGDQAIRGAEPFEMV